MKTKGLLAVGTALLFAISFLAGCSSFDAKPTGAQSEEFKSHIVEGKKDPRYEQVRRELLSPSVFRIVAWSKFRLTVSNGTVTKEQIVSCDDIGGTGFFVTRDGYAVTAAHVVVFPEEDDLCFARAKQDLKVKGLTVTRAEKALVIAVLINEGKPVKAKLIAADTTKDLALLQINGHFNPLELSNIANIAEQPATIIGNPYRVPGIVVFGKVARDLYDRQYLRVLAPTYPGDSGGPVITLNDSKVVGMVLMAPWDDAAKMYIALTAPAPEIRQFLTQNALGHKF